MRDHSLVLTLAAVSLLAAAAPAAAHTVNLTMGSHGGLSGPNVGVIHVPSGRGPAPQVGNGGGRGRGGPSIKRKH